MITIFIRTLILYTILIGVMRIMGKRQIGELEVSDLVTTLLLSEIASLPIEDPQMPIIYSVIPIVTLLSLEVILSVVLTRFPKLKATFSGIPSMIISKGKLSQKELKKNRISLDELLSELRQKDVADIDDVEYAILERNGKLSVICKNELPGSSGIAHAIVIDGRISEYNLSFLGLTKDWVLKQADRNKCRLDDIFLLTVNDAGKINIYIKEE